MKTDTLGHLIEIESKAAAMLMDAQTEADRRTAEARSQADADYKTQYEKLVGELESETEQNIRTPNSNTIGPLMHTKRNWPLVLAMKPLLTVW